MRALLIVGLVALFPTHIRSYSPMPTIKAMCAAYQVCQTCYAPDGRPYSCSCHMECLPGTEDHGRLPR
jgi:hypothetical protein